MRATSISTALSMDDGCNAISEEINAERARYTAMDPGSSPCADAPGTPMTVASQKQADYQTALNMWAGAVNDATEVCTVGHGLLVHNAGMYDRHYSVMKEITADLEELCAPRVRACQHVRACVSMHLCAFAGLTVMYKCTV